MVETYCMSLDGPEKSFKVTVPSTVGIHETRELVPATNSLGSKWTSKGFCIVTALAGTIASSRISDSALANHAGIK